MTQKYGDAHPGAGDGENTLMTGVLDAGLTGKDWILEQGADVHEVAELHYAKED